MSTNGVHEKDEGHIVDVPQSKMDPRSWKFNLNPLWENVDSYANSHLHPAGAHPDPHKMEAVLGHASHNGLPDIAVNAAQGKFLMLQARLINAQHILEVGTLGGYSALWFAAANPTVRITTVEVSPHHADIARENFDKAGKDVSSRIDIRTGRGIDVLPVVLKEVEEGKLPKIDMAFIDADKPNNWNYFDFAVKMCRGTGALIIVDNVVRRGRLADPDSMHDSMIAGSREVVEKVGKDSRVDGVVVQTVGDKNYDGMLMAVVR